MASIGTYDQVAAAGTSSLAVASIAGSATTYEVRDLLGAVVATGSVSAGAATIPAPTGALKAGWHLCLFKKAQWDGGVGYVVDALQVAALRENASLPPVPAAGTSPVASDLNNRGMDQYMHSFTAMGPNRWQIHDAAAPTVHTPSIEQGGTIAAIAANLALEKAAAGYTNPAYADSARPRPQYVTFPNNPSSEPGYAAGVAAAVAALGPGTASGVELFEGYNEPQGANGMTPAQSAAQYNAFRAAVKAGHASAKAMGPCEVCYAPTNSALTPQIQHFTLFLNAITPGSLDVASVHNYNSGNGDFSVTDRWLSDFRQALVNAGYSPTLPVWLTETGWIGTGDWGLHDPRRAVQWTAMLVLTAERHGIPKEQMSWFYDTRVVGFQPTWIKEITGDLRAVAVFFRAYSEEVFGKTYSSALDFGDIGDVFFRGNVYRGAGGTCVALTAQGNPAETVTLAITDTGPITVSDWQGRLSTVAVSGGQITVPIGDLPTYVRLSAGCTVSVVDAGNGLVAGSPTNIATAATASAASGTGTPALVNDGIYQTGGYLPTPDSAFHSVELPEAITLTWATEQTVSKVVIRQLAPWTNFPAPNGACAMVRGRLEYWNGSGWLPCPTVARAHWDDTGNYDNTTATSFLGQVGGSPYMLTFYDLNWCHNVDLAVPITTTKLRWTVTEATYGHLPDADCANYAPFGFGGLWEREVACSEILVIAASSPPPTVGPLVA